MEASGWKRRRRQRAGRCSRGGGEGMGRFSGLEEEAREGSVVLEEEEEAWEGGGRLEEEAREGGVGLEEEEGAWDGGGRSEEEEEEAQGRTACRRRRRRYGTVAAR